MTECGYCNKPLPITRHPNARYCDRLCRGRYRWAKEHIGNGVKCLVCGKIFVRVGSHVVQVHGYENVGEYRQEYGLMARETHTEEHAKDMRNKVTNKAIENLKLGEPNRFYVGGDHPKRIKEFWANRRLRKDSDGK